MISKKKVHSIFSTQKSTGLGFYDFINWICLLCKNKLESGKKEARKSKLEAPLKLEEVVAEAEKKSGTKKSTKSNTDTKAKADTKSSKGFTTKVFNRKAGSK